MLRTMWDSLHCCALFSTLLVAGFAFTIYAQPPMPQTAAPQSPPSFEAVSIHPAQPGSLGVSGFNKYPSNRYFAHNKMLSIIIGMAYETNGDRIKGEPGWLDSQLYSIDAKVDGDRELTAAEMRPLVQDLLAQRFHLKVHRETQMVSAYRLIVAKGGAKLQPADAKSSKPIGTISSNGIKAVDFDMEHLAVYLENPCHFPVVDGTGLTGHYDIDLSYAPSDGIDSSLPDLFTAIQEQLGLKLESTKIPIDYLVIDSIDRVPTGN
jgi:uncharacterized protein (TIGR03435 family)